MKYEWCKDLWTGYRFLMPKLNWELIEEFGLGTLDLADFTYLSTLTMFEGLSFEIPRRWPLLLDFLWRIENVLRLLSWTLLFKRHETLSMVIDKVRNFVFKVVDDLTWMYFNKISRRRRTCQK
ncbi:MAG: hypothetical protein ACP6IU_13050 [Candidatus Asgardarchaeia archaeon]